MSPVTHQTAYSQVCERRWLKFAAFLNVSPFGLLDMHWSFRRTDAAVFKVKQVINFKLILKMALKLYFLKVVYTIYHPV